MNTRVLIMFQHSEIHVYEECCKQIIQLVESNFARWLLSWWSNVPSFSFGNQVCSINVLLPDTTHTRFYITYISILHNIVIIRIANLYYINTVMINLYNCKEQFLKKKYLQYLNLKKYRDNKITRISKMQI